MSEAPAPALEAAEGCCPMCLRPVARARRWKELLGRRVCRGCRNRYVTRREVGYVVDHVAYMVVVFAVVAVLEALRLVVSANPARPGGPAAAGAGWIDEMAILLMGWAVGPAVFCLRDAWAGRSPGKALCGLRVVDAATRAPIPPGRSFKRNLPLLIPYLGVLVCLVTLYRGRRWGDRWAGALVVWEKYAHRPPFAADGRLCPACGYDLTGNVSGICPECGRPVVGHAPASEVA